MYSDKIRLVKETYYRRAILCVILMIGIVVLAFFTCIKHENGLQEFFSLFTSFSILSLYIVVCSVLAVFNYMIYKFNMKQREKFLTYGTKYAGEIIDTFAVKNWFGQGRSRNYKMVIRYAGDKEFVTPAYDPDMEYSIADNSCNVYVLNGKCYAADFYVVKKGKGIDDDIRPPRVREEDYLYCNIDPNNFDRAKFIDGRVIINIDKSYKYIMTMPRAVVFNDGAKKALVVDITIETTKKVGLFSSFEDELIAYAKLTAQTMSSEQLAEFNQLIRKKLEELLHTYYYFVKVKSIDVGEI